MRKNMEAVRIMERSMRVNLEAVGHTGSQRARLEVMGSCRGQ